jgi:hypothetical protein
MRGQECDHDLEVPPHLYRDVRWHFYSACIIMVIGMYAVACLL